MMLLFRLFTLVVTMTWFSGSAFALPDHEHSFRAKQKEGWFFYNEKIEKKKKKLKAAVNKAPEQAEKDHNPKKTLAQKYDGPPPMSAAWLKVNLPKYLNNALDNPTPNNVRAYLALQKLALDKSTRFSEAAKSLAMIDPVLDETTRHPVATSGVNIAKAMGAKGSDNLLKKMAKSLGLFVYYSQRQMCPYCDLIGSLVSAYKRLYGFTVLPVSLDGSPLPTSFPSNEGYKIDKGQSKYMKVKAAPAIYLVKASTGEFVSVIQGASISMEEFRQRLIFAALAKGWITEDEYRTSLPENNVPYLQEVNAVPTDKSGFVNPEYIVKMLGVSQ